MIKNFLLAVGLLSLAVAVGCAKGGNGVVTTPSISVSITSPANTNPFAIYPSQTLTLTAAVSNSTTTTVTWSLSCTGAANSCGTLTPVTPAPTPATATYVAPPCVNQTSMCLSGSEPTITATLTSDANITGTLGINLVDITTEVAAVTVTVGNTGGSGGGGLTQLFAVTATPYYAPQTFQWSCNAGGSGGPPCANFVQDPSGFAYYTADDTGCTGSCKVVISAITPNDQAGCLDNPSYCTIATVSLVSSRVSGTYAFQFSGYQNGSPIWVAGTFTANTSGTITSGVEELLTATGPSPQNPISITGGSYTPTTSDTNNSNNAGTLTLTLPQGIYPNQYQVVLDGAGDIAMIESDGQGTGSGSAEISSYKNFTGTTNQTYAFGFTGVDASGNRVGYVGVLPMNGSGSIAGAQVDVNDSGTANSYSSVTGSYYPDNVINGLWHVTGLPLASGTTLDFDFFVASGTTNKSNPFTFYAISTDTVRTANPAAVSGTMVLQDSSITQYNNAAFNGTSVSALTGVNGSNTNVSLTQGFTDGNGDFTGFFDQNNAGTILSGIQFPSASQSPSPYTYAASSSTNGRYIFQMLGNPSAKTVVAPIPFVLYASGANRGFLLDQSSPSVMTGTMNPVGRAPSLLGSSVFSTSELLGTYAASTTASGNSSVGPIAANLVLTIQAPQGGTVTYNVSGTQYQFPSPGSQPVAGTYSLQASGNGAIAPISPATSPNYAIYVLDTFGCNGTPKNPTPVCGITSFLMMDETTTPTPDQNASIIFAQQ